MNFEGQTFTLISNLDRNDDCICGSGKKFKKCCASNFKVPADALIVARDGMEYLANNFTKFEIGEESLEQLEFLSNIVVEYVKVKNFAVAHRVCDLLLKKYTDQIDGLTRHAFIYEEEGQLKNAIEFYQRAIQFTQNNPDFEGDETSNEFKSEIDRLQKLLVDSNQIISQ